VERKGSANLCESEAAEEVLYLRAVVATKCVVLSAQRTRHGSFVFPSREERRHPCPELREELAVPPCEA
jgi:hypothetical protein